jgi:hypothetical protein
MVPEINVPLTTLSKSIGSDGILIIPSDALPPRIVAIKVVIAATV